MKIRIEKENLPAFADSVSWVAKNLPNRPSVPVLAGVLLRARHGVLEVCGFDYEVSTRAAVDLADGGDDGTVLVSARLLAEIAKSLPAKPLDLAAVGAHLELVCGSARFTLPTMPTEDFPELPGMPSRAGTMPAALFAAAVAQVAVAAGRDETLPMMTGVRLEARGGQLAMLATDRYRLAVRETSWTPEDPEMDSNALIPAKTLEAAAKVLGAAVGDVTVSLATPAQGEGSIGFSAGGREMTSRLLDGGNYPPVRSLFPEKTNANAVVQVAALVEVVKRVALVADRTTPVLLSFSPDCLVVEAGGTEEARASEAMEIGSFTGDALTIGFNPQYLIDGLSHLGAQRAHIAFVDAFKPAVIAPASDDGEETTSYRYLIMPIRVSR